MDYIQSIYLTSKSLSSDEFYQVNNISIYKKTTNWPYVEIGLLESKSMTIFFGRIKKAIRRVFCSGSSKCLQLL